MSRAVRKVIELLEHKCYMGGGDIYSPPITNAALGMGERVIVHTAIGRISGGTGGSATITLTAEDSPDGENWATIDPDLHNAESITWDDLPYTLRSVVPYPHGHFLRLKLSIGGTNPTLWLSIKGVVKPHPGGESA